MVAVSSSGAGSLSTADSSGLLNDDGMQWV